MPLRDYICADPARSCPRCRNGFEALEHAGATPLLTCSRCGAPLVRQISAPRVPPTKGSFTDRAKRAGFHQLKRVDKGTYEKQF
jgi:predicted nucleic acid-binding Zn ribbon protein